MNPCLPYLYVNIREDFGSLALIKAEKENSEFKPAVLHLKIDLMLHPFHGQRG